MTKQDLLTGEIFTPKKSHQKFASPKNRIIYNNNKANSLRKRTEAINKPLHNNYLILSKLMADKEAQTFHKQFLLGCGFSFSVQTHIIKIENKEYAALYQYAIMPLDDDEIKIIVVKESTIDV